MPTTTTTIQIPPDVAASIRQQVERGRFPDAGEVVREAMRLLDEHERQLDALRAKLQSGLDQLDRGEGIPFTPEWSAERARIALKRAAAGDTSRH
jgi:antitoxin ParD1/3/4